mmetsp:Transcript_17001/g.47419  ORF Transcript_17001/g.47419 Transcript_17001/m.47419 type:complete len:206 (+) Transcript_17001:391-1008(+)
MGIRADGARRGLRFRHHALSRKLRIFISLCLLCRNSQGLRTCCNDGHAGSCRPGLSKPSSRGCRCPYLALHHHLFCGTSPLVSYGDGTAVFFDVFRGHAAHINEEASGWPKPPAVGGAVLYCTILLLLYSDLCDRHRVAAFSVERDKRSTYCAILDVLAYERRAWIPDKSCIDVGNQAHQCRHAEAAFHIKKCDHCCLWSCGVSG